MEGGLGTSTPSQGGSQEITFKQEQELFSNPID